VVVSGGGCSGGGGGLRDHNVVGWLVSLVVLLKLLGMEELVLDLLVQAAYT
jgi:hypothetical protein